MTDWLADILFAAGVTPLGLVALVCLLGVIALAVAIAPIVKWIEDRLEAAMPGDLPE